MVKEDITYQDKLNELRLDIAHPNKRNQTFVLVEGESDIRLFRKLFNLANCNVERVPGGNVMLEQCVAELYRIHSLIIGIRDLDFLGLSDVPYNKANMFKTDYHDIEIMMISEDEVFGAICHECVNTSAAQHPIVRDKIFRAIEDISYLKWLNYLENLELVFTPGFADLISWGTQSINFDAYLMRVFSKSPNARLADEAVVKSKIEQLKQRGPNRLLLCNGHDFVKAFSSYLASIGKVGLSNAEAVVAAMRVCYSINHFKETDLYESIKIWADTSNCSILN